MNVTTNFQRHWNPTRPYSTNSLKNGISRNTREKALSMKFIEAQSQLRNIIVIDIDTPDADYIVKEKAYDTETVPVPNYYTQNPTTGHAHVGYFLDGFTMKGTQADRTRKWISKSLTQLYGGDPAYTGFITRNPLVQPSEWLSDRTYRFADLIEFFPKTMKTYSNSTTVDDNILGRNHYIFENSRKTAYSMYRQLGYDSSLFYEMLAVHAETVNREYCSEIGIPPLSASEVNGIVKSVHGFVVENFTAKQFSKIQSARAKKRWSQHDDKADAILMMRDEGFSYREISDTLGLSVGTVKSTVSRKKKRM